MNEDEAAALFGALSNPDRLRVIRALVEAAPQGLNAGAVARRIHASPSRASFHLAALSDAGLVQRERQARNLIYRVDFPRIGGLMTFLLEDCCKGSAQLRGCCGF